MLRRCGLTQLLLVCAVLALMVGASVGARGMAQDRSVSAQVRVTERHARAVEAQRLQGLVGASFNRNFGSRDLRFRSELHAFYADRAFMPQWLLDHAELSTVLAALQDVAAHGLSPADYHLDAISSRLGDRDPTRLAELDLLVSDALLAYATHLRVGRFEPREVDEQWLIETEAYDPVTVLAQHARGAPIEQLLAGLPPKLPAYDKLRARLPAYETLVANGGWPKLPGRGTLKPGTTDPEIEILRARLRDEAQFSLSDNDGVVADTRGGDGQRNRSAVNHYFDEALSDVLKAYQRQHGLAPDGILGPNTRAMLNVPATVRLQQIKANLERLRWLPRDLGAHYIWVDIAAYQMSVVRDGKTVLTMPTIVGREARATPVFSDEMTYLEFNPYWNVPLSIAMRDLVPAQVENPDYLTEKRVVVRESWDADAARVPVHRVDWARYRGAPWREFPYHLQQQPGPNNALGVVKFMFPNPYGIYLHDTPHDALFDKTRRAFSSGCIRLAEPLRLAHYLLRDQPYAALPGVSATAHHDRWSPAAIEARVAAGRNERVELAAPLKVYIVYFTAWVDESGVIQFRDDLYERDDEVLDEVVELTPQRSGTAPKRPATAGADRGLRG